MIVHTAEELREQIADLERDERLWQNLEARHGALYRLQDELDTLYWLLGE